MPASKGKKMKAKAPAKAAPKKAVPAKTLNAKKSAGPIGSIKKMLGLGDKKQPAPKAAAKGAKPEMPKGKAIDIKTKVDPKAQTKMMGKAPKETAAAPQPGKKGKGAKHNGVIKGVSESLTTLSLSRRANSDTVRELSGPPVCREVACELISTTGGYCRMHYIKNWKKIQRKHMILREKKLNSYIEELVSKYPDKYIEAIRQDLASEKDFAKVIADLEIEEGLDDFENLDTESPEGIIDTIKRDFDDEGDVF